MELLQLKYFCLAAENENFSTVAKRFLVPTSNISQSIKRLERELGCELFDHRSNKVILNNDGRRFYENVSVALSLIDEGRERLGEGDEIRGEICLVCLNNRRTVTGAIERFIKEYPNVNFNIRHTMDPQDPFDLLISDAPPAEYGKRILIVDDQICIAMNKNHPLALSEELEISDLRGERFITMTTGSSLQRITVNACADAGFVPNIAIQTDDPFYLRKYVEMGMGIAFVPCNSWRGLFGDGVVLKHLGDIHRQTYAYLPKKRFIKQSVLLFVDTLCAQINEAYVKSNSRGNKNEDL